MGYGSMVPDRALLASPIWGLLDSPVIVADCVEAMAALPAASVDAVVSDPPYGIGFMGKEWDGVAIRDAAVRDAEQRTSLGPESASRPGREQPRASSAYGAAASYAGPVRAGKDFERWCEAWAREAWRVLKPGGHLLAFGGTRTYHRLAAGVEDAGFEIRDALSWMYGSGFPKSMDVGKAIDKAAGAEREVTGHRSPFPPDHPRPNKNFAKLAEAVGRANENASSLGFGREDMTADGVPVTAPATPEAAEWEGWGTALKPAWEPIVVARKPLTGTVAQTVLQHGTGALNIDGCRVAYQGQADESESKDKNRHGDFGSQHGGNAIYNDYSMLGDRENYDPPGRWPANVMLTHTDGCERVGERRVPATADVGAGNVSNTHAALEGGVRIRNGWSSPVADANGMEVVEEWACADGCPVRELDAQSGESDSTGTSGLGAFGTGVTYGGGEGLERGGQVGFGDRGGASRFFYVAKAGREERNAGLDGFEKRPILWSSGEQNPGSFQADGTDRSARNNHPTVKPIDVMRWLIRLVTPPGGVVLDPFCGSGTTGCAAALEGVAFVGVEREADYAAIARARIGWWSERPAGIATGDAVAGAARQRKVAESGQLGLL